VNLVKNLKLPIGVVLLTFAVFLINVSSAFADQGTSQQKKTAQAKPQKPVLVQWADQQLDTSIRKLMENISPSGAAKGAVIASPSTRDPDYFFYWVRDGALVMDTVVNLYKRESDPKLKGKYLGIIKDFIRFTDANQRTQTITGLGEPKYHADGRSFVGPWGRPQNDGPALRAITLIRYAEYLISKGKKSEISNLLYRTEIPAESVIKRDLEYVSHHWAVPSFDLWEEVLGDHFYTRMVQRRALIMGRDFARSMNDHGAANWYGKQAALIEKSILKFRDQKRNFIKTTRKRVGGLDYKSSNLDVAVILASNHSLGGDIFFGPNDEWVLATAHKLTKSFRKIYKVNHDTSKGVGFGRYPEDQYYGGNPWFLTTLAIAEYYYRSIRHARRTGGFKVTKVSKEFFDYLESRWGSMNPACLKKSKNGFYAYAMMMEADFLLKRVKAHAHPNGTMDEQFERRTGFMKSARDLTWSYASFITAMWQRDLAFK
jgi:glucoamylase